MTNRWYQLFLYKITKRQQSKKIYIHNFKQEWLKGDSNKNFIISFERDSKTIHRKEIQKQYIGTYIFYICFTLGDVTK